MKKILLAAAFVLTLGSASAQVSEIVKGKPRFSVGLEAGLPTGDAAEGFGVFLGGSAKVEVPLSGSLYGTGSAGFVNLSYEKDVKDAIDDLPKQNFIPVKVGAKYFFTQNIYGAGELGAVFGTAEGAGTAFAWTPGIGLSYPVSDKNNIDFDIRYESWANDGSLNQIGFRIALKF